MKFESAPKKQIGFYKSMKEDPAYQDEGISFEDFNGHNISGYTMAQKKDGKILAIGGEDGEVPYLHIGEIVKLTGEKRGMDQYGLDLNKSAEIVNFIEPFGKNNTDKIICVKQGEKKAWIKPFQITIDHLAHRALAN